MPQYLSFILSSAVNSDITSIGCHTTLWNFQQNKYHKWVKQEGIDKILPPIKTSNEVSGNADSNVPVGGGLHDSSAALIPYLVSFNEPFVLLSTGTWCITLNPFNHAQLTNNELNQDCLCFLSYESKPVKAARLFAGYDHEQQVKRLSLHFGKPNDYFTSVSCDAQLLNKLKRSAKTGRKTSDKTMMSQSAFAERNLDNFRNYEEAYHQLIADIISQQIKSTNLVLKGTGGEKNFCGWRLQQKCYLHAFAGQSIFFNRSVCGISATG